MVLGGIEQLQGASHDVCIVGSGPLGLALAAQLVKRGLRVLLLESGERAARAEIQALSDADIDPAVHDDMSIVTSRRLGGTSNLWGARALPFDPFDFEDRAWIDARWPIRYADMAAYLPAAVEVTASGAPVYRAGFEEHELDRRFANRDAPFSAAALERWANQPRAQTIHRDLIRNSPSLHVCTGATLVDMHFAEDGRVKEIEIRPSHGGPAITMPVRELVLAAGGIETVRLLLAAQRRAPQRFGGEAGPLGRYYQGHIVGEVAQIRFEKPATARAFDFRIDRHGSYVRRRIVASAATLRQERLLNCAFWPVVPRIGHARHRSAALSLVYLFLKMGPLARLIVAEKIRQMNFTAEDSGVLAHLANLARDAPAAAAFGLNFMRRRFSPKSRLPGVFMSNPAGRYGLSFHSEQSPNPDSRITLTDRFDRLGLPRLAIDLRFTRQDADAVLRQHALLGAWLRQQGIADLHYHLPAEERVASILSQARHGTHQIGIARMGATRRDGVVNGDCTTFDAPNLHLATTAVLPTSGQANPTLTAIALSLRLGDRLADRLARA